METEIEVKFLNVDHQSIREKLEAIGAARTKPMTEMKRVVFETFEPDKSILRLRDEGDKVTLTYKRFDELSLTGAKEIETVVTDFEATRAILESSGMQKSSFQESKREAWMIDDVEIVLDVWPWLPEYIEIEGKSERGVKKIASDLGFKWEEAMFGDATVAYREAYPNMKKELRDNIGLLGDIEFAKQPPAELGEICT